MEPLPTDNIVAASSGNIHIPNARILRKIGGGGFGNVYEGVTRDGVRIAYKVPYSEEYYEHNKQAGNIAPEIKESIKPSFIREAGILAKLGNRNPGVCRVREIGAGYIGTCLASHDLSTEFNEGNPYFGGRILEDCLDDMAYLLITLEILHHESVAHLDLKPGNILRSKAGNLKLCDFGSASVVRKEDISKFNKLKEEYKRTGHVTPSQIQDISLTDSGVTYGYAPPENFLINDANYELKPLYFSADIWSLGAVFYEMLTGIKFGSFVFERENPFPEGMFSKASVFEMLRSVTQDMNRDGFSIYEGLSFYAGPLEDKKMYRNGNYIGNWKSYLADLDPNYVRNKTLLDAITENQTKLRGGHKRLSRVQNVHISSVVELLKRMLDPNLFTRYTAKECLDSDIFASSRKIRTLRQDMWREYNSRPMRTYKIPRSHKPGNLYTSGIAQIRKAEKIGSLIIKDSLKELPALRDSFPRLLLIVDHRLGNRMPGKYYGAVIILTYILAMYVNYGLYTSMVRFYFPNSLDGLLGGEIWKGSREYIFNAVGGSIETDEQFYYLMYYLVVHVFEFNLWS